MIKFRAFCSRLLLIAALSPVAALAQTDASTTADTALQNLLTVLQDETARAALIDKLQATAPAVVDAPQEPVAIARQVVDITTNSINVARDEVLAVWRELSQLLSGALNERLAAALTWTEALMLAGTIVLTLLSLWLLQMLLRPLLAKLRPVSDEGLLQRGWKTAVATMLRLLAVAAAWALGTATAASMLNAGAQTFVLQSLYLNAFAVFGLCRVILAAIASPDAAQSPALTGAPALAQRETYRAIRPVLGVTVQGYMFVLPALQATAGYTAVRPVRSLVATVAAMLALWGIRRIARVSFAAPPAPGAETSASTIAQSMSFAWRRAWPPLAVMAVLYSWVMAVTRPAIAGGVVFSGMVHSALAVLLLIAAIRLARSATHWRAPLPASLGANLPELPPRLSRIGAIVAWVFTASLAIGAFLTLLHGWHIVDLRAISANTTTQLAIWRLTSALIVVLIAALFWATVASIIDRNLRNSLEGNNQAARRRTLLGLFRNSFTIALGTITVMLALSQLGIDIAPLLAGAGVIGLAIGFGSQKLVQDIITGIFIQFEGALNEGDVVTVAGITGGVEKVTIRSLRLRTIDGALHVIPFSSVDTVSNLTRDFGYHVAEIGVAYKEKVPDVKDAMQEAFARLQSEDHDQVILEQLEMHGVTALGDSAVVVRARIKTKPGLQWSIGRRYTELVKDVMDERGIEIPFPHRQLVIQGLPGALKSAMTPPEANISQDEAQG